MSPPPLPPDDPPPPPISSPPPPPENTPPHPPLPPDSGQPLPPGIEREEQVLVVNPLTFASPLLKPNPAMTSPLLTSQFPLPTLPPPPPPKSPPPPPDSTDVDGEPFPVTNNSGQLPVAYPVSQPVPAVAVPQGSVVSSSSSSTSGGELNSSLVYAASSLPSHVIARPPAKKDALRAELASFYSDLAFLEASGSIPQAPAEQNCITEPVPGPSTLPESEPLQANRQEAEMSKKKKKVKWNCMIISLFLVSCYELVREL